MRRIIRGTVAPVVLAVLVLSCAAREDALTPPPQAESPAEDEGPQRQAAAARGRALAQAPAGGEEDASEAPVPLGAALATTTNAALIGRDELLGVEIAQEVLNAQGGIGGRPIDIVVQDTGDDDGTARAAFQTLINSTQVVGVVGPTLAGQAPAISGIADQLGVPVLGPASATAGISGGGTFFRLSAPLSSSAPNAMDVALQEDPEIARVAFAFAEDDASSSAETVALQAAARERRLSISTVQTYKTTGTSFADVADAILGTEPGLVVISGTAADGGTLVRQLRELGYGGAIVAGRGMNTSELFGVCEADCEGVLVAQSYNPDVVNGANEVFRRVFQERHGREPAQPSAQSFAALQVLVEALRTIDSAQDLATLDLAAQRSALRDAIPTGEYETPLGTISFTPEGEINQEQSYVARVEMSEDGRTGRFAVIR